MSFYIRRHRRFPVLCPVTYHAGLHQGQGTVWNLSLNGWRLSGDVPLRIGQAIPITVTLPNRECIFVAAAIVRWRRGGASPLGEAQEYGLETIVMEKQTQSRLEQYVKRLVQEGTRAETLRQLRTPV